MHISKFVTPEIIFGNESLHQLGDCCQRLGARNVLIVTDEGVMSAGWYEMVTQICEESRLSFASFSQITTNPKDYEVVEGVRAYIENECDAVIGVGGGSVLDVAKAIAIVASNGGSIHDFEGVDKIMRPLPPLIMISTTAGSGSEVSQFAVILDTEKKKKMTIVSKSLVPDIAIVDPQTLVTKSRELTASTGMDVLTHGIEALVSIAATPLTDVQAKNAISLASRFLRPSVASKTNEEAKEAMAMASLQAGLAFSNAILGAVHGLSHAIGGRLDMSHGEVNAILLPHVMRFNWIAAPAKFKMIAELLGVNTAGMTDAAASLQAIEEVRRLSREIEAPQRLSEIGFKVEDREEVAKMAIDDACMITNPRDVSVTDLMNILTEAL